MVVGQVSQDGDEEWQLIFMVKVSGDGENEPFALVLGRRMRWWTCNVRLLS